MKIFSKTHTITASAASAVVPHKDANGKALSGTLIVQHPAGTLLDLPDDSADDLVDRNFAVKFDEEQHKVVDGKVVFVPPQIQSEPPLPEGATRPTMVRQDDTLNDASAGQRTAAGGAGVVVVGDEKDTPAKVAEQERTAAANAARAAAGGAAGAGTAQK